ncbi:MAG: winged helix-turn-helix transcriptional regulator [Nitrososphaeria archaeon]
MIDVEGRRVCLYPSEPIIRLVGKEYTILIVGFLGNTGKARFNEIARNVGNPRPNLLSHRLHEMEEAGLILRGVLHSKPVSVEYSLTDKGRELRRLLIPLFEWLEKVQH